MFFDALVAYLERKRETRVLKRDKRIYFLAKDFAAISIQSFPGLEYGRNVSV